MENTKSIATSMATSWNLDKDEKGKPVEERKYWGMIGYLIYLTASHPYIMFGVCLCSLKNTWKNHISVRSNSSWYIYLVHHKWAYDTPKEKTVT